MHFAKLFVPVLALFIVACGPTPPVSAPAAPTLAIPETPVTAVEPTAPVAPVDTPTVAVEPTLPTEATIETSTETGTETGAEITGAWTREQFNTAWDIAYPEGWTVNRAGAHEGAIQVEGDFEGHTYAVTFSYPIGIFAQSLEAWVEEALAPLTPEEQAAVVTSDLIVDNAPTKQLLNLPNQNGNSPMHQVYIWRADERNPRLITITQVDDQPVDAAAMASLLAQFIAQVY
jgi:hypothetical protein